MRDVTEVLEVAPAPDRGLRGRLGAWLRDLMGRAEALPASALPALTLRRLHVRIVGEVSQDGTVSLDELNRLLERAGDPIVVGPEGVVGGGTIAEAVERIGKSCDALVAAARWELQAMGKARPAEQAAFVAIAEASFTGISPTWRTRRRLRLRRELYYLTIADLARQSLKALEAYPFVRLAEVYAGTRMDPPPCAPYPGPTA